jgi:hypothetical protein
MDLENTADSGAEAFDIGAAMDAIAVADPAAADPADQPEGTETDPAAAAPVDTAPVTRAPPTSWAKDYHEHWAKTDPKVQDYIEKREKDFLDGLEQYKGDAGYAKQFREVVTPYAQMFQAAGVSEADGIKFLLHAQHQLTSGTIEQRRAAFERFGADLGLVTKAADPNAPPVDPVVKQLQDQVNQLQSGLTARQEADLASAKAKAASEIDAFAADPAHGYFDEVAPDMVLFINAGHSLKDAYEKAVRVNPVTWAKEQSRLQTEAVAKAQENARLDGLKAMKAKGANVRGVESRTAPTEPKGSFQDLDASMRDSLATIKARNH